MSVSDHTSKMKAIAMGDVAETILQNTTSNIADFERKQLMIYLRRTYGTKNEDKKRLSLLSFFEETMREKGIQSSNLLQLHETSKSSSAQSEKATSIDLLLSPLKRQMSQITLDTEKNQLTYMPQDKNENLDEAAANEPYIRKTPYVFWLPELRLSLLCART
ncbi:hypothetical protein LIER_38957 [Lithospermum erythrorhizon]|uniref:Uncharacterized protein n=1 Tax=Lithospermum erythrorhizon TaxID=34254 RepID=A0AAV3QA00_LITER